MSDKHFPVSRGEMVPQIGLTVPPLSHSASHIEDRPQVNQGGRTPMSSGTASTLSSTPSGVVNPRKRKLTLTEVAQLRRKVSESEGQRILLSASRYAERCAVRCYLGGGGSPAEYPTWRNRLPPVPLISYLVANRLDSENMSEDLYSLLRSNTSTLIRTAAVTSSSQETPANVPHSPSHGTRVLVASPTSATPSFILSSTSSLDKNVSRPVMRLPVSPYKSTLSPIKSESGGDISPSNQEHIVERAKQEAYVMQRVAELQRDGLWSEKRVPKLQELPRPKSHWDYLLEEMVWLAADFAQERMWKKAAAKKCATMVQRYFRDKEESARRKEEEQELERRRIAGIMAGEVKMFWSYISKLVAHKKRTMEEESQKRLLNHHLNPFNVQSSSLDFNDESEATMLEDEEESREVQMLKKESCLTLEELIGDYLDVRDTLPSSPSVNTECSLDDVKVPSVNVTEGEKVAEAEESAVEESNEIIVGLSEDDSFDDTEESSYEEDTCDEKMECDTSLEPAQEIPLPEEVIKIAETLYPKGETLSSSEDVIKVPFLLRKKLREYQHIGYSWLVSLYERKLNGILADESGLGKTVQVITLFAHLACEKGVWGPHLIIVPTQEVLNWEIEFKKWCPSLKVLAYYGSAEERKLKRYGWARPNAFHVCITSYKIISEDIMSFRKKKWKYLVLDEAQHIGLIRWQSFKNIRTIRKLLLTGNHIGKYQLSSFAQFLLPDWSEKEQLKFEQVLKPLSLGRSMSQVEMQMPRKIEHIVTCRLSSRQRCLYDDYMSKNGTNEKLRSGRVVDVLSVLLALRKICNHPELFEARSVSSPFCMDRLKLVIPSVVATALDYDPFDKIDLSSWDFNLIGLESCLSAFVAHRSGRFKTPRKLIEEIDTIVEPQQCPRKLGGIKISIQKKNPSTSSISKSTVRPALVQIGSGTNSQRVSPTKIGTSPIVKAAVIQQNSVSQGVTLRLANPIGQIQNYLQIVGQQGRVTQTRLAHIVNTPAGKQILISPHQLLSSQPSTVVTASGQRLTVVSKQGVSPASLRPLLRLPPLAVSSSPNLLLGATNSDSPTDNNIISTKTNLYDNPSKVHLDKNPSKNIVDKSISISIDTEDKYRKTDGTDYVDKRREKLNLVYRMNEKRCSRLPVYGTDVISRVTIIDNVKQTNWNWTGSVLCRKSKIMDNTEFKHLSDSILSLEDRVKECEDLIRLVLNKVAVTAPSIQLDVTRGAPWKMKEIIKVEQIFKRASKSLDRLLHPLATPLQLKFPEGRLIRYDSGKLRVLANLLRKLKIHHHRVIIFTQMTQMLDVFETFLKRYNFPYLRLDGTTEMDKRQMIIDRFNNDPRIFCCVMSSRSGTAGLNITGADNVIFYDYEWNPSMNLNLEHHCKRILQCRDINIFRFQTSKTVEENYTNRYIQKRLYNDLLIEGHDLSDAYFKTSTVQDLFNIDVTETSGDVRKSFIRDRSVEAKVNEGGDKKNEAGSVLESILALVEDKVDLKSARITSSEKDVKFSEFNEETTTEEELPEYHQTEEENELENLEQDLSNIEKYAIRFIEESDIVDQVSLAEKHWEQVKKGWETTKFQERERLKRKLDSLSDEEEITYSSVDARCPDWVTKFGLSMPIWAPPTPPQDDNDMYIDESLCLLYEPTLIPEAQLPPAYTKKDRKRSRMELNLINSRLQSNKIRQKEETLVHAPRSLFDRPTPALVKMRQELRLQRYRGLMRPAVQNLLKPPLPVKPLPEPDHVPDWLVHEDWTILQAVQHVQEMTVNLVVLSPGHTPNWDLVADMVNMSSRTYRSPKQCRNRYESVIIPREEGKPVPDSPKKQKKNKLLYKPPQVKSGRPLRTSQLFQQDNNSSMTQVMNCRFDAIRSVSNRRAPTVKPLLVDPTMKNNPRHADTLARSQIDYDRPLNPIEVAAKRADRIAREKLINAAPIQVTGINDQAQLAVIRQQQLQKLATLTVQEMVATVGGNRTVVSTSGLPVSRTVNAEVKASSSAPSPSGSGGSSAPTSPSTVASPVPTKTATKTISAAQLYLARQQQHQQALLRQQQLKLLKSQQGAAGGTAGSSTPPKVSIAVTPPQSPATGTSAVTTVPRMQQVVVKSGRAVTESEMVALFKRQQAAKVSAGGQSPATLATTQILTSIQLKALNAASAQGDTTTVLPQQVKPITLPHQFFAAAHQQRTGKIAGGQQKVAQFAQVPTKGAAGGTQLIVQSGHKTLPTTVTVQQIQQVMKQVRPGHVVVAGPGRSGTIPGTVSLEGRQVLAGALKTSQQAILTQVSGVATSSSRGSSTPLVSAPLITIPPNSSPSQPSTSDSQSSQHH